MKNAKGSEHPLAADLEFILERTRSMWEELRGGRLFITGGTGFIGCWLLESFAWANERLALRAETIVLTRNPEAFSRKAPHLARGMGIQLLAGDVRDFGFPRGGFSHVIHAATEASAKLNEENPALMLDTIVGGTRRALDFTLHCGAKKLLLTSSGAVYGMQPPEVARLPENFPGAPDVGNPRSAYGEGKRASELLCAIYSRAGAFEAKIARCFAFVGPYLPLDVHFAIGNFIRDAMEGGPIIVKGDGSPYRSYLYAADMATWLWSILFRGVSGRPYNTGSESAITIAQTAEAVSRVVGRTARVSISQPADPAQPALRYVPDTSRARAELGLEAWTSLEEAIGRTARWVEAQEKSRGNPIQLTG